MWNRNDKNFVKMDEGVMSISSDFLDADWNYLNEQGIIILKMELV